MKDKQAELVDLLVTAEVEGLIRNDANGHEIQLSTIDPFTFFFAIYKHGDKKCLDILQNLSESIGITAPNDIFGIPHTDVRLVWGYLHGIDGNDSKIRGIWRCFEKAVNHELTDEDFTAILKIDGFGKPKLSQGLFLTDPDFYFNLDKQTTKYLREKYAISVNFKSYTEYMAVLMKIKEKTNMTFPEISFNAAQFSNGGASLDSEIRTKESSSPQQDDTRPSPKLNQILYGPPGTGKTYNSISKAVEIADPAFWATITNENAQRKEITKRYKELVDKGRIVFTTFHQSMCYEDFIEGIKPVTDENGGGISYDIEPGIFKRICTQAALPDQNNFDKAYTSLTESLTNMDEPLELTTQNGSVFGISLNSKENLSLHTGNPLVKRATLTKDKLMTFITGIGSPAFYKGYYQGVIDYMKKEHELVVGLEDNKIDNTMDASNHDDSDHVKSGKIELGRSELFDLAYQQLVTDIQSHIDRGSRYMFDTKKGAQHEAININADGSIQIKRLDANMKAYHVLRERLKDLFIKFPDAENLTIKEHDIFMRKSLHQGASNGPTYIAILLRLNKISNTIISSSSAKVGTASISTPNKDKQDSAPPKTSPTNYILIIDEINRGNVSQIFGELITLIEPDKRAGMPEALEVTLPYSKEKFSVPPNLYIIGTMNTADRSVEALDTALRRRFSFKEMAPDYDLLTGKKVHDIDLGSLLKTINNRIEALLDKDHAIGHSYFLRVLKAECSLKDVFFNEIIPLLQEYFYGNYSRIELVLGTAFVKSEQITQGTFAKSAANNDGFVDGTRYSLVRSMEDDKFITAVQNLMS
jgi:5-methylcytosine-specific restriction protein B